MFFSSFHIWFLRLLICYNVTGPAYHWVKINLPNDQLAEPALSLGFPGGSAGKESTCKQETWVRSLGWEDSLEKGKATHSSILAWRIQWTIQSMQTCEKELFRLDLREWAEFR